MLRIKDHVNKVTAGVTEELKQKADPNDPGVEAVVARTIQQHVDAYGKGQNMAPIDAQRVAVGVAEEVAGKLKAEGLDVLGDLVGRIGQTALKKKNEIGQRELQLYTQFRPQDFEGVPAPKPSQLAEALAAVASFAGTLGAPNAHDFWYRRSVGNTVLGDDAVKVGKDQIASRPTMLPFEVIVDNAMDVKDDLLHRALDLNRGGIANALRGMAIALSGNAPKGGVDFEKQAAALTDPFAKSKLDFEMPREVVAHLHRLGEQLKHLHQAAERDPKNIPWRENPLAYEALKATQGLWAKNNMEGGQRYQKYLGFDDLNPATAARNIPVLLAAIDGALRSRDLVGELLKTGPIGQSAAASEDGFLLQLHLVSGSRQALVGQSFDSRNQTHARVVADESMITAAHALGATIKDGKILSGLHSVFYEAAIKAGDEFKEGGRGASGGAFVAVDFAGAVLKAARPDAKGDAKAMQKRALDILSRASLDDIANIVVTGFGREKVPESDKALRDNLHQLGVDLKDEWFAGLVPHLPVKSDQKRPLDAEEQKDLELLLRLANVTWKSGQIHRAEAGNDPTRIDPYKRGGVYRPYDLLVSPQGSVYESIYVVAKDLHELVEKGKLAAAA